MKSLPSNEVATSLVTTNIATVVSPVSGGSASGGGSVNSGSSVSVVAIANTGYTFVNWSEEGAPVSTSLTYTFAAQAGRTL